MELKTDDELVEEEEDESVDELEVFVELLLEVCGLEELEELEDLEDLEV